jgi:hypothetical protein
LKTSKLILHIGPHKTGSTYIQKVFFENREKLLSVGVRYPNIGLNGQYGQHELVEKIKQLDAAPLMRHMADFIGPETNFISSENFDRLNAGEVKKFGQALAGLLADPAGLGIIYYHRNYGDLLPSWWQEEVKHGSIASFYEFILPHVLRPFASNLINPAVVLDLYAHVFGKDKITVVDYDRAKSDLLKPILELLGIDLGAVANETVNSSLKVELIEILRALNAIAKRRGEWHFHKTRTLFLRKLNDGEIVADVEALTTLIRSYMKPIRIGGGFFEKTVNARFRAKYGSRYINKPSEEAAVRELMIPGDFWMVEGLTPCIRIYEHIMTGDVRY